MRHGERETSMPADAPGALMPEHAVRVPFGAFALYGGLALLLEESFRRIVLPTGRRGVARSALEGDLPHQVQQAQQEPGVRRQL